MQQCGEGSRVRTSKEAAARAAASLETNLRYLELLGQRNVDESPDRIIDEVRRADGVAEATKGLWRVGAEHVVTTHADAGVVQQILPTRHGVIRRLTGFDSFAVFATHDFFAVFRISCDWLRFNRRRERNCVSSLHIKDPRCLDPMLLLRIRQERSVEQDFVETVRVVNGSEDIELIPSPVE